ncbi:hypothetical protein [Rubritalea sp.]|uniref:hypothetical protein n=1 Tax=Rubritalea sp. TaxID=2109375 RepID=UPI003EF89906
MKTPLEKLIAAVRGEEVFGTPLDGIIRHVSDEITGHTFLDACSKCDLDDPEWPAQLARELNRRSSQVEQEQESGLGGESWEEPVAGQVQQEYEVFLKLNYRTAEASLYQFELFPRLNKSYIKDFEKLKVRDAHYLKLVLESKNDLELFVRSLRSNQYLKSVEKISAEEFQRVA